MTTYGSTGLILAFLTATASAQLDAPRLVTAHRDHDLARNSGWGQADSPDSGALGWGESSVLAAYAQLWEVTEDVYWLGKIRDHFRRIMGTATDPDGDGFLSWQTSTYSCAVAWAESLHNVSVAEITPARQKNTDGKAAVGCTGLEYLIEFAGPTVFRIVEAESRKALAENLTYQPGAHITEIQPFKFQIHGTPHLGDRFLIVTRRPEALEFTVHQGMMAYPVAQFIAAVKTRADLAEAFGKDADDFLAFFNRHLFEKNEQDWLDMGDLGGAYRFQPKLTDRFPNRIMPHNQFAALARAWLVLKDVPGAHPLMAQRAEQMVRYFRRHLEPDETKNAWKWHYWDWTEKGVSDHSGYEDTSHASINVSLAVEAARRGVGFTAEDMQRMANTWLKLMWNQDAAKPLMASAVDGRAPFKFSALLQEWSKLAQWDRQVYDLALVSFLAKSEKEQAVWAPAMLLCARRAGVALPGLAKPANADVQPR